MVLPSEVRPNHFLLGSEFVATSIAVALAFVWPQIGARIFERIERSLARIARTKVGGSRVGASVIVLRAALLPCFPFHCRLCRRFQLSAGRRHVRARTPDESDPSMWTHFESIHITMQPTYQSMYFRDKG